MRVTAISAAILAFASSVLAQTAGFDPISKPAENENVPAGQTYDIIWTPGTVTGTVTLSVIGGATQATLTDKGLIASNVDNSLGKFSWPVPATLGADAIYGIKIVLDSTPTTFQFSFPFHIVGGGAPSGNTTTTVTSASSTATVTVTMSSASSGAVTSTSSSDSATTTTSAGGSGLTSTRTVTQARASTTTTRTTTSANGAATAHAGSLAVLGGLAMAALAL